MQKLFKFLVFLIAVLFFFTACTQKKNKPIIWRFGHNGNTDHLWHKTAVYFAKLVKERSHGKMEVLIYPNGQLGSEPELINSVRLGTLDMVISGETLQNWAPKAALMAVPFAFKDGSQMRKVLAGKVGDEIKEDIREKAGLIPVYYHERAPRNLTTNRVINNVDDIEGLIIRVPAVPAFVKTWEVLGAKPTPMSLQEVFTSLQQNTIQAQENPYDLIYSMGFYEVQKYVYQTEHVTQWIYALVGEKQFNKLSPKLKEVIMSSAADAQIYAQEQFEKFNAQAKQNLIDKGMKIKKIDREELKKKVVPAMKNILTPEQYKLYQRMLEV